MKGLVYTALFGGRDKPMAVSPYDGVDYLMFTDGEVPAGWERGPRTPFTNPRLRARLIKTLAPVEPWGEKYDWTMWVDASHKPNISPQLIAEAWFSKGQPFAAYAHHVWNCTYTEIRKCIQLKKDTAARLEPVAAFFREQGFPENYGQIASTILLRWQCDVVRQHALAWHQDMTLMSIRDQVSFMYEIWKLGYKDPTEVLAVVGPNAFKNFQFHYQGGH
jgi:hypothetical protein